MNQKAVYEITITEKLEQLSVPDMVDAIWARIETQLDIDMPPDEGPGEPPAAPRTGGGKWIGSIFIAALIAIIYFTNIRKTTNNNDQPLLQETPTINNATGTSNDKPPPAQTNTPVSPRFTPNAAQPLPPLSRADSTAVADSPVVSPLVLNDSAVNNPVVNAPPPVTPLRDSSKPKSRGVKGITDADYRIVPAKRDSSD